ncbi:hypothetical protein ACIBQX_50545 [Nonomuraea sp. NPDC049714]|uniref:hypothetical protein n=1 Tax=Nonomuraea sp. NPDC049714 TaxID=3364357 RepID=UPI0037A15B85
MTDLGRSVQVTEDSARLRPLEQRARNPLGQRPKLGIPRHNEMAFLGWRKPQDPVAGRGRLRPEIWKAWHAATGTTPGDNP